MRAIVLDKKAAYVINRPEPEPKAGEALIRVRSAGVCATDLELIKGYMGFKGVPGHEFCGVVSESSDKTLINKRVAGEINIGCNRCDWCASGRRNHCPDRQVLGILDKDGVFAEYVTLPNENLHILPDEISDEEAVFIEPLGAAFEISEQVDVKGRDVCVLGDGRLGLLCAQALNLAGCRLTAIGRHAEKLAILEARGIKTRLGIEGLKKTFDVVVDCTGSDTGFDDALSLVRPAGTVVLKTTVATRQAVNLNQLVIDEITVVGSRCGPFKPAIEALADKRVDVKGLIAKTFSIEDGVEALEYAARKGVMKVLIKI
ncbi:MAG: alcohol dehydrogenase [Deltaproteobacteria bacterium RIFCSPLOWO2_02_FULL_53_8]|nr:MAG: alcohol dehydrogenase [Deltaproteobacteria bacterium RIFCSPLOWO2_02_FULL_53_8]